MAMKYPAAAQVGRILLLQSNKASHAAIMRNIDEELKPLLAELQKEVGGSEFVLDGVVYKLTAEEVKPSGIKCFEN